MSTQKRSRCKNGTRKNKKTGNCESVLDHTCAICLDRITSQNVKTKCKHNFHKQCLVGWCKSQKQKETPQCPICRSTIKDTCKKIMPFDSEEVFRYTRLVGGTSSERTEHSLQKIKDIIFDDKFDVNVTDERGRSILYELSWNSFYNRYYKDLVDHLLKHPKIIVNASLVSDIIGRNNQEMIALYKKHKKIPKSLKNLI